MYKRNLATSKSTDQTSFFLPGIDQNAAGLRGKREGTTPFTVRTFAKLQRSWGRNILYSLADMLCSLQETASEKTEKKLTKPKKALHRLQSAQDILEVIFELDNTRQALASSCGCDRGHCFQIRSVLRRQLSLI